MCESSHWQSEQLFDLSCSVFVFLRKNCGFRAVRWLTHQLVVLGDKKALILTDVWELEEFRQINCFVPLRIDRPTMLKWNSCHFTSFAEETGGRLLRNVSSRSNFRWIWLVLEYPYGGLLFCFGLIRIDTWFVVCDDPVNVFWSTAIVFFQYFYAPIDTSLFWAIVKLCEIQRE